MLIVLGIVIGNFLCASGIAWWCGVHRAKHGGDWQLHCHHIVCESAGGVPICIAAFFFGPIVILILLLFAWFGMLMRAPSLRKMEPLNSHPSGKRKIDE